MDAVYLKLPQDMRRELCRIAAEADVTPGQIVRDLLAKEILRRQKARPPVRADERLVAPLRARLAADLADADSWADLARRLAAKGYALREAGGGLALYSHPEGRRLCKASELGFSYGRLVRRFRTPFPGHSHAWLAERFLADAAADEADIALIES